MRATTTGQNSSGLAARRVQSRREPEPLPFRSRLTPDDLNITGRAVAVQRMATEDGVKHALAREYGDREYKATRADGATNEYRRFLAMLYRLYSVGASSAKLRLYEADLCAFLNQLDRGTARRPMHDVKASEARHECQSQIVWADLQRRIASGEPETAAMWDAMAQAEAMDIAHDIEFFGACQARASELRQAERAAQTPTVQVVR